MLTTRPKEEPKVDIRFASQFIEIVKRDLGTSLELKDVHLGRLNFHFDEEGKSSGYLCFYCMQGVETQRSILYLKAFSGRTKRSAQIRTLIEVGKPGEVSLCSRQEISIGDSFKAKGENWYYVYTDDRQDFQIVEKDLHIRRQLDQARAAEKLKKAI